MVMGGKIIFQRVCFFLPNFRVLRRNIALLRGAETFCRAKAKFLGGKTTVKASKYTFSSHPISFFFFPLCPFRSSVVNLTKHQEYIWSQIQKKKLRSSILHERKCLVLGIFFVAFWHFHNSKQKKIFLITVMWKRLMLWCAEIYANLFLN